MKSLVCGVLLLFCFLATPATAAWAHRRAPTTVRTPVQVKVYPAPVWETCNMGHRHCVQPEPYWETQYINRIEWIWEQYWVPDPVLIYHTSPSFGVPIYETWQPQ